MAFTRSLTITVVLAAMVSSACQTGQSWGETRKAGEDGSCPTTESLDGSVYCDLSAVRHASSRLTDCMQNGGGRSCLVDDWFCSITERTDDDRDDGPSLGYGYCDLSDLYSCLCGGGGGSCVDRCYGDPSPSRSEGASGDIYRGRREDDGTTPDSSRSGGTGGDCTPEESLDGSVYCDLNYVRHHASEIASCIQDGYGRSCLVDDYYYCSFELIPDYFLDDRCDLSGLYSCLCGGGGGSCVDRCDGDPAPSPSEGADDELPPSRSDGAGGDCPTTESLDGSVYCDLNSVRYNGSEIASCIQDGYGRSCLVDDYYYCSFELIPDYFLDDRCDLSDLYSCLCGGGGGSCVDRCY